MPLQLRVHLASQKDTAESLEMNLCYGNRFLYCICVGIKRCNAPAAQHFRLFRAVRVAASLRARAAPRIPECARRLPVGLSQTTKESIFNSA